ncbi:MAG: PCRF domain-containing protein [Parcubacteria group bacterium]
MSLDELKKELEKIEGQLNDPEFVSDYKLVAEASKRYAEIQRTIESGGESSGNKYNEVIIEIRPGAGGDESAIFSQQLFEMYQKYAELNAWTLKILDHHTTSIGGAKYIAFEIDGKNVYNKMHYESGVHRVQRVPTTEKSGRVHTSTVTVAVLKKAKETDVEIKPDDIDVSFYRSGGPGGQNVNKVSTAVRIVHKPSGITVTSQKERSQSRNKEIAMELLRTKILDLKQQQESGKVADERRKQVGTGDRSEKIRTYNFPQDRITDHRIKKNWGKIEKILEGNMDPLVDSLLEAEAQKA